MKSIRLLTMVLLAATLFTACNKDEGTPEVSNTPVQFTTAITKAAGTTWGSTDQIGVFMMNNGTALDAERLADNVKLETTNGTDFTLATPIYYPQSGTVDFVAYYPYRASLATPYIYNVDVSTQTTPANIDLLYSNNATNKSRSTSAVGLTFVHKLSKVVLNIKKGAGVTDLTGLSGVAIGGMPTKADFKLANGEFETPTNVDYITPNKLATATPTYDATYEAIVIPQKASEWSSRKLVFTIGTDVYEYAIAYTDDFLSGKTHTYNITIKKSGVTASRGAITDWEGTDNTSGDLGEATSIIPQTVKITAGTFLMGSSDGSNIGDGAGTGLNTTPSEPNRWNNETQHKVTLTKDFYMSKYAVTFAQYDAFCDATGRGKSGDQSWGRGYRPVINVTWNDAVAYCTWLSEQTGQTWRLPTEAEWEYACRGGQTTSLPFGIGTGYELKNTNANFYWQSSWSWDGSNTNATISNTGSYPGKTMPVGSYASNAWGLYDMHGNVWEWCSDWYRAYTANAAIDPKGADSGSDRVLRGGSWFYDALLCRSAFRINYFPDFAYNNIGFRVVFVP